MSESTTEPPPEESEPGLTCCPVPEISTEQEEESQRESLPLETLSEVEETIVAVKASKSLGATRDAPEAPAVLIKKTLDRLEKSSLKSFKFQLKNYHRDGCSAVPPSKLEDKDTMDIAEIVTDYYGCEEALRVTRDILNKINQRALVSQLESHIEVKEDHSSSSESEKDKEEPESSSGKKLKKKKKKKKRCCFFAVNIDMNF